MHALACSIFKNTYLCKKNFKLNIIYEICGNVCLAIWHVEDLTNNILLILKSDIHWSWPMRQYYRNKPVQIHDFWHFCGYNILEVLVICILWKLFFDIISFHRLKLSTLTAHTYKKFNLWMILLKYFLLFIIIKNKPIPSFSNKKKLLKSMLTLIKSSPRILITGLFRWSDA